MGGFNRKGRKGKSTSKGANKTTDKSSQKTGAKINVNRCPAGMTLEQWQRALRRQIAERETFAVQAPGVAGKPFMVRSCGSDRIYAVRYFGADSSLNRCECMDFKTSRLGTCKHIEAVSLASGGKYARRRYEDSHNTSVYVDYTAGRKVKIRMGSVGREEMKRLGMSLFDISGEIRDLTCDPSFFIREARRIDPDFVWESDAMNLIIEARDKAKRRAIIEERYRESVFDGLLKTSLLPYQVEGVKFAFREGRTINADEMGLGKTVQALATAELLKREGMIESVLIICPTSLKYQWLAEIRRFTDSPALVIEGNVLQRDEQFFDRRYFYKICSYHAMSNSIKANHIPEADMIIYDELQRLKNKDTQMGKQLRKLRSQYVVALSGTPLENKLDELYSVTQFADQFILGPYYRFTEETTLKDETGKIIGYRNLHDVAQKMRHTLIRRRKADVKLQMPKRTDTILYVPMTKEQRAIHDDYKFQISILINKWHRFKFLSESDRQRLLLFLSKMRMVCDSTFILDLKTRHDTKINEIKAIIANKLDEAEGKVVIFSQWERMLRILAEDLREDNLDFCFLHGGVPSVKRKELIDRFRDDARCRIFLSTDAGATGLNLQSANLLINVDLPWNPAVLEQRIARIYRLGQNNPVQIINMVAKDTIEERMLSTLTFKSNIAAGVLDGGEDAVFLADSKFSRILDTVESVVVEESAERVTETEGDRDVEEAEERKEKNRATENGDTPEGEKAKTREPQGKGSTTGREAANIGTAEEMRNMVAEGITALGKLAKALSDPQSARNLADALVKEDPATGATTLNIPVPDKTTVINILTAFSTLLNK